MKKITGDQLRAAVERAGLPAGTWEKIEAALAAEPESAAAFEAAHVSYYLGALLIIGAMGLVRPQRLGPAFRSGDRGDRNCVCAPIRSSRVAAIPLRIHQNPGRLIGYSCCLHDPAGGVRCRTCPGMVASDGSWFLYPLPSIDQWELGRDGDRHSDCLCCGADQD